MSRTGTAVCAAGAGMVSAHPSAEEEGAFQGQWVTKTFLVPENFTNECLDAVPRGRASGRGGRGALPGAGASFPSLPEGDASAATWHLVIAQCTGMVSRALAKLGLDAPEGSLFLYDESSATLAVRTTAAYHALLEPIFAAYLRTPPQMLVFELEVLESETALMRWCLAESQDTKDHTDVFDHLTQFARSGEAKFVRQIRLETRPGQRAVSESDYGEARGARDVSSGFRGARLVVEAEVNPQETDLALKVDFSFQCSPHAGNGSEPEKDRELRLVTNTVMSAGTTRLLAVWTPDHSGKSRMQAAFLRAEMVPLLPLENPGLADLLARYASPPQEPAVARGETLGKPKSRMELRVIKVRPEFCPARTGFSSEALVGTLKYHGISFPDEARVNFLPAISMLVAWNTPKNLDAIQLFMEGTRGNSSKVANITLEIVEGETGLMRTLMERSRNVADHRVSWREVESLAAEGKMKLVRTARLEVRHGEKGWFAAGKMGNASASAMPSVLGGSSRAAVQTAPGIVRRMALGRDGSGNGHQNGSHLSKFTAPARLIGTWLEVAPTINGSSMDVEIELEHHYACPPDFKYVNGNGNGNGNGHGHGHENGNGNGNGHGNGSGNGNGNGNGHEVHEYLTDMPGAVAGGRRFRCSSSITARPGMIRLVGLWSPEENSSESDHPTMMQAAFLRVDQAWAKSEPRS